MSESAISSASSSGRSTPPQPRITVIVPVRNMETTIGRTLDSVVRQNYPAIELIVVDGRSDDRTLDTARRYQNQIAHLVSEPDCGMYEAINKGVHLASGDLIGVLNGDDYFAHPGVLSLYAEKFASGNADIVFGDLEFFPPGAPGKTLRRYSSKGFHPAKLRYGWMPPHPTVYARRSVFELVGEYKTDYKISADFDFLIRALLIHGVAYDRLDSVVVRMQYGGLSTSGLRATYTLNSEIIRACHENGLKTSWPLLSLKVPAKLSEFLAARRSNGGAVDDATTPSAARTSVSPGKPR